MSRFVWLPISLALAGSLLAQAPFSDLQSHPAAKPPAVAYLFPEQVSIAADKPASVDLHFKVAAGLHVNSHNPRSEELIPTTFKLPDTPGVRLTKADFPAGTDFALVADPNEKLSVYTGEFIIHAELVAAKGEHLVQATLRYQACSNDTCMPPHSIPVAIDVIAK
jgi:Disulphide bond corrector protein DsbC